MAVIAPTGNSVGGTTVRASVSAITMAIAPHNRRRRNQQPVIRTKNQSHRVWHKQTDVADRAAGRNRQRRQKRRANVHNKLHARHVHAQVNGFALTRQQQIQVGGGAVNRANGHKAGPP